ncbi:MAG TPA: hypothetical protein PLL94_01185 [Bacteroidales bacterium]|jgi:hypothetical protein|nr:MAG: hypothetical protein BWX96_01535 [Bacteroidetes bacterium ADurb.Bin145]HOU00877.1 hypothetical protein [Bacteroidales bacterium]HQK66732.1 hypothetical protein [Bacteroidales bacterium]
MKKWISNVVIIRQMLIFNIKTTIIDKILILFSNLISIIRNNFGFAFQPAEYFGFKQINNNIFISTI